LCSCSYPLDVCKSRVQLVRRVAPTSLTRSQAAEPPKGAFYITDTLRTIVRTEGPAALFRGIVPTCASRAPGLS